jgi:hypothetical protein
MSDEIVIWWELTLPICCTASPPDLKKDLRSSRNDVSIAHRKVGLASQMTPRCVSLVPRVSDDVKMVKQASSHRYK